MITIKLAKKYQAEKTLVTITKDIVKKREAVFHFVDNKDFSSAIGKPFKIDYLYYCGEPFCRLKTRTGKHHNIKWKDTDVRLSLFECMIPLTAIRKYV